MITRADALWTLAVTVVAALLQLLQLAIAARYLSAADFGVLAIVNIALWLVQTFQGMGLSSYAVHLGEQSRTVQSTLFWIGLLLGLVAGLLILLLAWPLAWFYQMPALTGLMPLVALNFLLLGLASQYQANLVRTFKAVLLAKIEVFARVLSFLPTLYLLVVCDWGLYAIVLSGVLFSLIKLIGLVMVALPAWHPQWAFERQLAKGALSYGAFQAGSQFINQLRTQLDQLIIGKALGAEALGLYSLTKELISYPVRFIYPLVSRLVLPTLARYQHNAPALAASFVAGTRKVAVASCAIYVVMLLFAPWLVALLYGQEFAAVAALVPFFAIYGALRPLAINAGMLAQALGRTANEFSWNIISALIAVPVILFVAWLYPHVEGFALALSLLQLLLSFVAFRYFIRPLAEVQFGLYVRAWLLPLLLVLIAQLLASQLHLPPLSEVIQLLWGLVK